MAPGRSLFAFLATLACASLGLKTGVFAQAPTEAPKSAPAKADAPVAGVQPDAPNAEPPQRGPGNRSDRPRGSERDHADHPDGDGKGPDGRGRGPGRDGRGPQGPPDPQTAQELDALREQVTKELNKLSQDDREEVWRTVWASLHLPQEQKKSLLKMDDDRRLARKQADQIIEANGIQLSNEQRHRFFRRFFPERRTIEETLKKEGDARRVVLLQEFNAKLKVEFATPAGSPANPTPTPDAPKVDGPKPGGNFPFRPPRGDRGEGGPGEAKGPGDGKGPGDSKNPDGKGPDDRPRGDWRGPGRGGPGGPGGAGPFGPGFQGPPGPPSAKEREAMRDRMMKDIEKLNQEQRTKIWRTAAAVLKLTPEQRKSILTMENERRQKERDDVRKEMDEAIANDGLQFTTNEQRGKFFFRYFNGRRSVEETLKKEDEARRAALMKELGAKLKAEFAAVQVAPVPGAPEQK